MRAGDDQRNAVPLASTSAHHVGAPRASPYVEVVALTRLRGSVRLGRDRSIRVLGGAVALADGAGETFALLSTGGRVWGWVTRESALNDADEWDAWADAYEAGENPGNAAFARVMAVRIRCGGRHASRRRVANTLQPRPARAAVHQRSPRPSGKRSVCLRHGRDRAVVPSASADGLRPAGPTPGAAGASAVARQALQSSRTRR